MLKVLVSANGAYRRPTIETQILVYFLSMPNLHCFSQLTVFFLFFFSNVLGSFLCKRSS